jgi:hypothetical protein
MTEAAAIKEAAAINEEMLHVLLVSTARRSERSTRSSWRRLHQT